MAEAAIQGVDQLIRGDTHSDTPTNPWTSQEYLATGGNSADYILHQSQNLDWIKKNNSDNQKNAKDQIQWFVNPYTLFTYMQIYIVYYIFYYICIYA